MVGNFLGVGVLRIGISLSIGAVIFHGVISNAFGVGDRRKCPYDLISWPRTVPFQATVEHRPVSTSVETLAIDFEQRVLPFFRKAGKKGKMVGKGGVLLKYRKFIVPNEKGAIVISHGRGETLNEYPELIFNFAENGYSVYILDQRGHGRSGGKDRFNPSKVHIDRFEDYVDDLKVFVDTVVKKDPHTKVHLFGHSMGGLITSLYASLYPEDFHKLVLSAPMFGIRLHGIPDAMARSLLSFIKRMGWGKFYAYGQTDPPQDVSAVKEWTTRRRFVEELKAHPMFRGRAVRMGGSTFGWVAEAMLSGDKALKVSSLIPNPVLLIQAGKDNWVKNSDQDQFAESLPSCTKITLPESSHEVHMEKDEIRDEAMNAIFSFLEQGS